jgi:hypothetical protein
MGLQSIVLDPGKRCVQSTKSPTEAPFPMEQIRLGLTEHSTDAAAVKRT